MTLGSSQWGFRTHIIYKFRVDYNIQEGLLLTRLIAASSRFYFVSILSGSVLLPARMTH